MERLTGEKYKSFLESYVSIYDVDSEDVQEQENIQEFVQMIDELVEEGCDLSVFDYDALYEYYLEESKAKAALELIKTGIRSALKMPAAAPIRKTLAKGALKGAAETGAKVVRAGNVLGTAYRGGRDILSKHPVVSAAAAGLGAYDLSKGERSYIGKGVGLAGQAIGAANRALYGDGKPPTAAPSTPTPAPAQPSKPKSLRILDGKVVGYDHFDPLNVSSGDILDETHNNGDTEIVEGRDFALQGGKPGFTIKDKGGTRWVPIDTKTFDKGELDRLTADYSRRRGSAQIEKDMQAHRDAKAKQDAARKPQAPATPSTPSSTPSSSTPSTPTAKPEPSSTPSSSFTWDPNKNIIAAKGGKLGIMDKGDPKSWRQPSEQEKGEIPISSTNAFRNSPAGQEFIKQRDASKGTSSSTSSASASTSDKIKGGSEVYKRQIKTGDIKGAEKTGMDVWKAKYADTLAKNVTPSGTQKGTGQSVMAKQAAELRSLRPATAKPAPGNENPGYSGPPTPTTPQAQSKLSGGAYSSNATKLMSQRSKNILGVKEEYDACDIVLEYLLSTGQADTINEALYVMMEMDSNCIQSIVENRGMSHSGGKPGASGDGSKPKGITGGTTYKMKGWENDDDKTSKVKGV